MGLMETVDRQFIGNAAAVKRLRDRAAAGGTGVHAYVLTGPAGVGKRTLAERFATMLLCTGELTDGDGISGLAPCGQCPSCRLSAAGNHPDFHVLRREEPVGIERIRELIHTLELRPHTGRHQVGLIPDAERLGIPAQNALLKLLEEPPARAVLVLTASSPASLLPTTVSRCQRIPLGPVDAGELAAGLAERGASDTELVAARAEHRPGRAIRLAEDPAVAEAVVEHEAALLAVLTASIPGRLATAKALAEDRDVLRETLDAWIAVFRAALREHPAGAARTLAETLPLPERQAGLVRLFAARRNLRYNPNTQLVTEHLLLNLGTKC